MVVFFKASLREVLAETLGLEASAIPIKSFVDSNNLYQAAKLTKSVVDRRLRINIVQIQECVKESKVEIIWVKTDDMLVDCMTKRGGKPDGLITVITALILPSIKEAKKFWVHLVKDTVKDIDKDIDEDYKEDIGY